MTYWADPPLRTAYREQLLALQEKGTLAQAIAEMGTLELVRSREGAIEYALSTVRAGTPREFYILFILDTDGVWRLRDL